MTQPNSTVSVKAGTKKSCGSCQNWYGPENGGLRQCNWNYPELPFWANISEGDDHDNWTDKSEGKRCRTWVAKS